ncbi:MAG: PAS domain-containing protein [Candidatus Paceibacterota bacterium]
MEILQNLNPYSLPNFVVGLSLLILGLTVWLRNKKILQNFLFFLFAVSASLWLLIYSVIYNIADPKTALFLFKIGYSFALALIVLATHFLFLFLGLEKKFKGFIIFSYIFASLFILLNLSTPLIIKGVFKYFWGYYPNVSTLFNSIYLVFFVGCVLILQIFSWRQFFLLRKRISSILDTGTTKMGLNKIKLIIIGISIFILAAVDFTAGYGVEIYPFGYLPVSIFVGLLAYAIFHKKSLDTNTETLEKNVQEQVEKIRRQYQNVIENTPMCIKVFDENMKMVFLNKGGREEHFIKDTDDISKWDWVGTVKKEYQAEAKEKFQNAFTKGEASTIEFEHTPEGSTHEWCSSLISPIKDKNGKVKTVLFLSSDITALKKAELEAKQNEQMFKTLLDFTPMCIKWFGSDGKLISINRGGREEHYLEKLSEEEIKKWDYIGCIEEVYRSKAREKMKMAYEGAPSSMELEHMAGTSKNKWCNSNFVPVKNKKGEVDYVLLISRDITQEKLADEEKKKDIEKAEETKSALFNILEDAKESEANLKEERDRSQAIISSMGEGLFVVDKNYKIILVNKATEKLFEISTADILGKDVRNVWKVFKGEEIVPDDERPITKTLKTGGIFHVKLEDNFYYQTSVGKKIPVEIITTPLKGNGVTGVVVVFQDISEMKALDESQKSFISIASHQLRTPLTSIRWYAEMLDSEDAGPLNKNQKEFVGRVYGGALKLNEVINLLLSMARIESGKTEMEVKKVSLVPFTNDVIKELEPLLKQKGLKTEIIMKEKDLPEIDYDASMLRQIVTNLLSNSIRYTNDKGLIQVIIEKMPGSIVYSIKDDGIGIPENQRSKIFGKFFRADNAVSKVPDGSGLGLSLVKALVEINKGTIWFETPASWVDEAGKEVKKGTVFHFTIPIK